MIINYDDFQHVKFIFSQNFISLFWGLFIDETDLRVRYWQTRVMACFASMIFYLQRLKILLKKHFTIVFEDCPDRSLKIFIWSAHSNEMKWTRSELFFSSAQFSFLGRSRIVFEMSQYLPTRTRLSASKNAHQNLIIWKERGKKKKKKVWRWSAIIWCPEKFGVTYFAPAPPAQYRNWPPISELH